MRILSPSKIPIFHSIKTIPNHILKPNQTLYKVNSVQDIVGIRKACQLAKEILKFASIQLKQGMTTNQLDDLVYNEIIKCNWWNFIGN